jgi:hypothetical protein
MNRTLDPLHYLSQKYGIVIANLKNYPSKSYFRNKSSNVHPLNAIYHSRNSRFPALLALFQMSFVVIEVIDYDVTRLICEIYFI